MATKNQQKWVRRLWLALVILAGLGMIIFLLAPGLSFY